jgi:hypothetical protein
LGRFTFGAGLLFFVAIAIAAMAVLTIHKFLRTLALTITSLGNELGIPLHSTAIRIKMEKGGLRTAPLLCPILAVSNRIATLGAARDTSLKFLVQKELPTSKSRRWDNIVCNSMGIRSQAGK